MKILLVSGHTSGYNKCSVTSVNEGDLNIEVIKTLKSLLDPYAEIDVYPYDRDMYHDNKNGCLKVDLSKYDYVYEQHFNAFNGSAYGNEVMIHENYKGSITVEQRITDAIASFGYKKRRDNGIYRTSGFLNMSTCYKLGVKYCLNELCFYDNVSDMNCFKENKSAIIQGIANAIISGFALTKANPKTTIYRVGTAWKNGKCVNQHNAFGKLENAKHDCEEAKKENNISYYVFDENGKAVYAAEINTNNSNKKVQVICSELNVRKSPTVSDSGNIMTSVKKGTKLEYIDKVKGSDGSDLYKVAVYVSARSDLSKLV